MAGEKLRTKFNNLTQKHKGVDEKDRTSRDLRQTCALLDKLEDPLGHFLALISFLAGSKPKVSFLGISLPRNQTETLAMQATW